ncbi:MAG: prenyltransferase [Gammaproteobacteria bacterium]
MIKNSIDSYHHLGAYIISCQGKGGVIAWEPKSKIDPWDHVESAMGLDVLGFQSNSIKAYDWLKNSQEKDGSWFSEYLGDKAVNLKKETNFAAYIATGAWHHFLNFKDKQFLKDLWPTISKAMEFVVSGQTKDGDILWAKDENNDWMDDSLLTGCSSIYKSLLCFQKISFELGFSEKIYEKETNWLFNAIKNKSQRFDRNWKSKDRYSMDWYYPILCGIISDNEAKLRIDARWDEFVVQGLGCKCVEEEPWVTAAESCELVLTLVKMSEKKKAEEIFSNVCALADPESKLFWTGYVFKDKKYWPEEKPSWTAAAVILAANSLYGFSESSNFFSD